MWKICICDDDKNTLETLSEELQLINSENISREEFEVVTYDTGSDLAEAAKEGYRPDILLIDISLMNENGIDVAKNIQKYTPGCQIIFISGYDDYYLDVYVVDHVYFLRKPVKKENLKVAMDKALKKATEKRRQVFTFNSNGKIMVLPMDRILYFEKNKRKILIHMIDGSQYEYYGLMKNFVNKIPDKTFVRCHNSYVVNLNRVKGLMKEEFLLEEEIKIPISRTYSKAAKEKFVEYIHDSL